MKYLFVLSTCMLLMACSKKVATSSSEEKSLLKISKSGCLGPCLAYVAKISNRGTLAVKSPSMGIDSTFVLSDKELAYLNAKLYEVETARDLELLSSPVEAVDEQTTTFTFEDGKIIKGAGQLPVSLNNLELTVIKLIENHGIRLNSIPATLEHISQYIVFLDKDMPLEQLDMPEAYLRFFVHKLSDRSASWLLDLTEVDKSDQERIVGQLKSISGVKSIIVDAPLEPR